MTEPAPPLEPGAPIPGAARLGLQIFLLSLGVLFAASLVAYFSVRFGGQDWLPPGAPGLPGIFLLSTLLLLLSSFTIHRALQGVRQGSQADLRRGMRQTCLLGLGFLLCQGMGWAQLVMLQVSAHPSLYAFTFFLLTVLHALHVVGGLIPLGVTTTRALRGRYSQAEHTGVELCAMYWHFLDGAWLAIVATLALFN